MLGALPLAWPACAEPSGPVEAREQLAASGQTAGESPAPRHPRRHLRHATSPKATSKISLGYYTGDSPSFSAIEAYSQYLNIVSADVFSVTSAGEIAGNFPADTLTYDSANAIHTYACVANYSDAFDPELGHSAIVTSKDKVIANLLALAQQGRFDGVNIDFEGLFPTDRAAFSVFITDLAAALHAGGFKLAISVPAKTTDNQYDTWSWPFDYASLGRDADLIQMMTYDENGPWGSPGPVSGSDWVEACIQYAVTVISRSKLLIGLPAYGYDWDGADASNDSEFSWKDVLALLTRTGATPQWDATSSSPYITYRDASGHDHVAWYENARSITAKTKLVNRYGIAGISMWSLGQEDIGFWTAAMAGLQ